MLQRLGSWPTRNVTTGLQFMRGWSDSSVGNGPPELRGAFLENAGCESNGYFNSIVVGTCGAQLKVDVDLGSAATRIASNVEGRYKVEVRDKTARRTATTATRAS